MKKYTTLVCAVLVGNFTALFAMEAPQKQGSSVVAIANQSDNIVYVLYPNPSVPAHKMRGIGCYTRALILPEQDFERKIDLQQEHSIAVWGRKTNNIILGTKAGLFEFSLYKGAGTFNMYKTIQSGMTDTAMPVDYRTVPLKTSSMIIIINPDGTPNLGFR